MKEVGMEMLWLINNHIVYSRIDIIREGLYAQNPKII